MIRKGYKECPVCAEEIREKAKMCRFCGAILTDEPLPPIAPPGSVPPLDDEDGGDATSVEIGRLVESHYSAHAAGSASRHASRILHVAGQLRQSICLLLSVAAVSCLIAPLSGSAELSQSCWLGRSSPD